MPKGVPNKRYTPEFKKMVVETMKKEHLSIYATMQEFGINDHKIIERWERIYLIGAYENLSCRFAPKTAPKRSWDGSSPYGILLYTWDKIHFAPWYATLPNPTKQHCNAQILDFS